jgi:hypothetical protein
LAGMATLGFATASDLAAMGPGNPAAAPGSQTETCRNSTKSIQQLATIDNARDGNYQCCPVTLDQADVGWRLINRFEQTVWHIVVRTRRIPVIGMFGIANLEGACTQLAQ